MNLNKAIRILSLVAHQPDPCNRAYVDQDKAAKVVLAELRLLQAKVDKLEVELEWTRGLVERQESEAVQS